MQVQVIDVHGTVLVRLLVGRLLQMMCLYACDEAYV
jgi:hypothetical protein